MPPIFKFANREVDSQHCPTFIHESKREMNEYSSRLFYHEKAKDIVKSKSYHTKVIADTTIEACRETYSINQLEEDGRNSLRKE